MTQGSAGVSQRACAKGRATARFHDLARSRTLRAVVRAAAAALRAALARNGSRRAALRAALPCGRAPITAAVASVEARRVSMGREGDS